MVTKRTLLIDLAAAFLAGAAAGLAAGGYCGFRTGMSLILNESLSKDAREVGSRIAMLKNIRSGDRAQAIETLEAGMDDLLVIFDPAEPYPGLKPQTTAALKKTIADAKEYRAQHPRKPKKKHARDDMVKNLFEREPYK